jgi:hypothetical protein
MNGRPRTVLLTFANPPFYAQQKQLNASAIAAGIDECAAWTDSRLRETAFYRAHEDIFRAPRGFGYWLWKPFLIRCELERLSAGDIVIYYDVGRRHYPYRITRSLDPLLDWCVRSNGGMLPGVYVPGYGPNRKWIKRECFVMMGCDSPEFWEHPQVQATYSIWQKSARAEAFVDEWLGWCTNPAALTDDIADANIPNFPEFVEHRHDQAIATLLTIKHGIKCYGTPDTDIPGAKDINNLVDRILGNEASIKVRNLKRGFEKRVRKRLIAFENWRSRHGAHSL